MLQRKQTLFLFAIETHLLCGTIEASFCSFMGPFHSLSQCITIGTNDRFEMLSISSKVEFDLGFIDCTLQRHLLYEQRSLLCPWSFVSHSNLTQIPEVPL
jgi:hypothetical protein